MADRGARWHLLVQFPGRPRGQQRAGTRVMNAASLAKSTKFGTFVIVFAISAAILYVAYDLIGWTLFTVHPATGRLEWGRTLPRPNEGPVMYWYGWTVAAIIGGAIFGFLATLLPENVARKIPLFLIWLVPLLAVPALIYSLMPFWTK